MVSVDTPTVALQQVEFMWKYTVPVYYGTNYCSRVDVQYGTLRDKPTYFWESVNSIKQGRVKQQGSGSRAGLIRDPHHRSD
jgi:hypothetical protein